MLNKRNGKVIRYKLHTPNALVFIIVVIKVNIVNKILFTDDMFIREIT